MFSITIVFRQSISMPLNVQSASGFAINLLVELALLELSIMVPVSFLAFYVCVCSYFRSCVDDLATILVDANDDISDRVSMKRKLVHFIGLHLDCYR